MKKIYMIFALLSAVSLLAQQRVAEKVQKLAEEGKNFKVIAPFSAIASSHKKESVVRNAAFAVIDTGALQDIVEAAPETFAIAVPYHDQNIQVQLYKVDIFAPGFHVDSDQQQNIATENGLHYRGIVTGDNNSLASFNFFKGEMNGVISSPGFGNLVVAKQLHEDGESYIIYSDANLEITNTFACHTEEPAQTEQLQRSPHDVASTRCVTMYFEIDHDLYLQNNSSLQQTATWMTSVYNNVQTLFNNDGITTSLKSMFIWTTPDPYNGDSSGDYLGQFGSLRPVFDGDLGQLVGIDPGGLGGVAITVGGTCSDNNFSYSDVNFQYANVPLFSWTIQVITHELGHLMGSPHTHGCYWGPNNNTAIDGCGSSQGYVEGNCAQGPIPSSFVRGTIMSYCHLVPGNGVNFANGFGPQPAQRIRNHVENSYCLSTDCINTCINTVNDFTVNATTSSVIITWTTTNNSTGPWQFAMATLDGNFTNWQTTTSNSFSVESLAPNTYYKFGIRPICGDDRIAEIRTLTFATNAVNLCSGVQFMDTGGLIANYPNSQYLLRTYTPDTGGTRIRAVFSTFNTEAGYDYFYAYNGPTATNDNLIGVYNGTSSPGTLQSTAPDGSLTFKFVSDLYTTAAGWRAAISCISSLSNDDAAFTNFSYYPNPSKGLVTVKAAEAFTSVAVYNVAGQLLKQQSVSDTEAIVDISSFADGVYFFRVVNDSRQANFRIVKQ